MRIAHVSDFHVSRYGNTYEERKSPLKEATGAGWETLSEEDGWRIEIQPAAAGGGAAVMLRGRF